MIFLFAFSRTVIAHCDTVEPAIHIVAELHANRVPAKFAARSGLIAPHATLISDSLKIIAHERHCQLHVAGAAAFVRHEGEALDY